MRSNHIVRQRGIAKMVTTKLNQRNQQRSRLELAEIITRAGRIPLWNDEYVNQSKYSINPEFTKCAIGLSGICIRNLASSKSNH